MLCNSQGYRAAAAVFRSSGCSGLTAQRVWTKQHLPKNSCCTILHDVRSLPSSANLLGDVILKRTTFYFIAVAPETPRPTSFLSMHYNLRHSLARAYAIRADARRAISQSAAAKRALPFVLNTHKGTQEDRDERVVRMLMFGKPGAGKGTLTARLTRKYPIISLSTGDLLRQHIAERTEIGLEAEEIVARGGLLPDETVLKVLTSKLDSLQHKVRRATILLLLTPSEHTVP